MSRDDGCIGIKQDGYSKPFFHWMCPECGAENWESELPRGKKLCVKDALSIGRCLFHSSPQHLSELIQTILATKEVRHCEIFLPLFKRTPEMILG